MTFNTTDVNVTCCNLDGTPMSVTCGQGLSCAASCFSLEATLCPSHNCEACATFEDLTNDDQRQRLALASWNLKHCPGPGFYCMVGQHQQCCFHPLCRAKKWQKRKCSWLQYHTGRSNVEIQRISLHDLLAGHSCPRPGDIQHGHWSCEEQQIPIPETANFGGELKTYPGTKNYKLKSNS